MGYLGKKAEYSGAKDLKPLGELTSGSRPTYYPTLDPGHIVFCGYDQGLGEKLYACENLEEMERLYDGYSIGGAIRIYWYSGLGPITIHHGLPGQTEIR